MAGVGRAVITAGAAVLLAGALVVGPSLVSLGGREPAPAPPPAPVPTMPPTVRPTPCDPDDVRLSLAPIATGERRKAVVLLLSGGGPSGCTVRGQPSVTGLSAGGRIRLATTRSGPLGGVRAGTEPPDALLGDGSHGSALIEGHVPGPGDPACPRYTAFVVTVPGATRPVQLPVIDPDSAQLCAAAVHPIVPGTAAEPWPRRPAQPVPPALDAPPCATTALVLRTAGSSVGASTQITQLILTNLGRPCTLRGSPGLTMQDRGRVVAAILPSTDPVNGSAAVRLDTGQSAFTRYRGNVGGGTPDQPCPDWTTLAITPPGSPPGTAEPLRLNNTVGDDPDGLTYNCGLGTEPVTPGQR